MFLVTLSSLKDNKEVLDLAFEELRILYVCLAFEELRILYVCLVFEVLRILYVWTFHILDNPMSEMPYRFGK
jgi:hypothetical protein